MASLIRTIEIPGTGLLSTVAVQLATPTFAGLNEREPIE